MVYSTLRYVSHEQALGRKTYAGKSKAACGNYHQGKECLDIHLLKAAAHEANPSLGLVPCADDARPEWVTYYSTRIALLKPLGTQASGGSDL